MPLKKKADRKKRDDAKKKLHVESAPHHLKYGGGVKTFPLSFLGFSALKVLGKVLGGACVLAVARGLLSQHYTAQHSTVQYNADRVQNVGPSLRHVGVAALGLCG